MASLPLTEDIRRAIGDSPKVEFNETISDGTNAAWRLTNAPIEMASESVFITGVIQQRATVVGTLKAPAAKDDYTLEVDTDISVYSLGDQIVLENDPSPTRYQVAGKGDTTLTLARRLPRDYVAGNNIWRVTRSYSFDEEAGIIYFTAVPVEGARLAAKFRYFKYDQTFIDGILKDAEACVALDISAPVTTDDSAQKPLVMLKIRELVLRGQVNDGASSAIKIVQGSTKLDLTGSTNTIMRELESLTKEYHRLVKAYLYSDGESAIGTAVVGRLEYIWAAQNVGGRGGGVGVRGPA